MITLRCSAILFDMDGVLIDSTPAVARVWDGWAKEHGLDPADVVRRAHGRPSIETIRELLPNTDHVAEDREVERREMHDLEGVVPLPGAWQLLHSLPVNRWTIVTSCTRPLAQVRLKTAGLPMPVHMVTFADVGSGKPHPEPYLKAAARLGFAAEDCLVVEDVPAGIRAGKAAGACVLAFTTTVGREELQAAGADFIARNCSDLSLGRGEELTLSLRA